MGWAAGCPRGSRGGSGRYRERGEELKLLDLERSVRPDWFQDPAMVGYVCYVDRFTGTLDGSVGTSTTCRAGRPQPLRRRARLGAGRPGRRPRGRGDVLVFPDRELPDAYERTLPEVFPDFAPGNFSFLPETGKRVWTGFNTFQWDLNWSNPRVFVEMAEVLLNLANRGVEVLRLDAIGFIWKRLGTSCQNQPEVHDLLLALRACARIVVPAVVFKAEAIVSPVDLAAYPGVGRHHGHISDLAYHNSLMVRFWSAVATRDARLATLVLGRLPAKPASTAWATYLRCHDDIGWRPWTRTRPATGWSGSAHRRLLADFYAGKFPGSFAATSTTRPGRPTTAGCTARRWTGTWPAAGPSPAPWPGASAPRWSGSPRPAAAPRTCTRPPRWRWSTSSSPSCSRSCAATRSAPWSRSTTSPSSPGGSAPWPSTWSATTRPVDRISGRPARVDHGQVVLDPYQAVWLTAPDG